MLDQVAAAFERQDYQTASELLSKLSQDSPDHPWVQFYIGRLHEVSSRHTEAEKVYRQLLQNTTNTKVIAQARQGLARLSAIEQAERQQAIAQFKAANQTQLGILILEPIHTDKTIAAQKFAQIMQIDPYTARLLLPSRGWRLYRTGEIGELIYYGEQLKLAGIPCFWTTIASIQAIRVFQVSHFQEISPQATVICRNEANQVGSLTFNWSEVKGSVNGLLPIFEEVVDQDARRKLLRKTQTQDYAQFCDLHIKDRCILRLSDSNYQFQKGEKIATQANLNTVRINWNSILAFLDQQLPQIKTWSDFTHFAESVLDHTEALSPISSHIHLLRREETSWDPAFQLYSGLAFYRG